MKTIAVLLLLACLNIACTEPDRTSISEVDRTYRPSNVERDELIDPNTKFPTKEFVIDEEGGWVETRLNDLTVDMTVYDLELLGETDKDANEYIYVGMQLFNNWCSGCHARKIEYNGVNLKEYTESWPRFLLVTDPDHTKYVPDPRVHFFDLSEYTLDIHEIDAIRAYCQRKNVIQ